MLFLTRLIGDIVVKGWQLLKDLLSVQKIVQELAGGTMEWNFIKVFEPLFFGVYMNWRVTDIADRLCNKFRLYNSQLKTNLERKSLLFNDAYQYWKKRETVGRNLEQNFKYQKANFAI